MDYLEFMYLFRNAAIEARLKIKSAHLALISGLFEKWGESDFYSCFIKDVDLSNLCCLSLSTLARTRKRLAKHGLLKIEYQRKLRAGLRSHGYRFLFVPEDLINDDDDTSEENEGWVDE